jgi:hypothetical protein
MPPSPVVVEKMLVQFEPSGDTWIWYARPNAASQLSVTWLMLYDWPRSTWIHCGSLKPLDHRVPVLPSVAFAGPRLAFSTEDAVVGFPWAMFDPPPPPLGGLL